MRVSVYWPNLLPLSIRSYVENVVAELDALGVQVVRFSQSDPLPTNVDLHWDPGTGRPGPHRRFSKTRQPLVVTFHGAANLSMPPHECFGSGWRNRGRAFKSKFATKKEWRRTQNKYAAVVAVSQYAKQEIATVLRVSKDIVFPIYHGVDLEIFYPESEIADAGTDSYLLHVSQPQPKKNVDRLISAYALIDPQERPQLKLVAPGYKISDPLAGLCLYQSPLDHDELAILYRGALGFIFPSLHETFGMPIVEAMASGCPVITSNSTGCAEIAGDAAILVNPRSVDEIADAMRRLISDRNLRLSLREKGLARAQQFTWRRSAEQHMAVFNKVLEG